MPGLVFFIDVDNTLIDNDGVKKDLDAHLQVELGPRLAARFWELLVFFIDVDNTLIDNDGVKKDLDAHLQVELGPRLAARFWELYEKVREEEGVVDIPVALRRLREQTSPAELDEQTFLHVLSIFYNY